jgi:hypothetical protein
MRYYGDHPKYLKKIGAPNNDYHLWTPYLAERGDIEPFVPPVDEYAVLADAKGYKLQTYGPGLYRILGPAGEVLCKGLRGRTAADRQLQELAGGEEDDSTGTAGEGEEAA